jgi:hypothetical protein
VTEVSYPVAWQCEGEPRLVGSAALDGTTLVLAGHEIGVQAGARHLRLARGDVEHVELRRSSPLPAVFALHRGRPLVIEVLMGGWGAAHQLADGMARLAAAAAPAATAAGPGAAVRVAMVAEVVPGRRARLEEILEHELPAELRSRGVEDEEVCLGDSDVVLVVTGSERDVDALVHAGLGLGGTVAHVRVLARAFAWRRHAPGNPVPAG